MLRFGASASSFVTYTNSEVSIAQLRVVYAKNQLKPVLPRSPIKGEGGRAAREECTVMAEMPKWIDIDGQGTAREIEGPATQEYTSPEGRRYVIDIYREIDVETREIVWTRRIREQLANGETRFPNYRELFETEDDATSGAVEEIEEREAFERESRDFLPENSGG